MHKIAATCSLLFVFTTSYEQTKFQKDFDFYWNTINDNYAYFDHVKTNWGKVKTIYQPMVDSCTTVDGFIHLLEAVNNELYNGHTFLNTNTGSSNRPIPTGSDLNVMYVNGNYVIDEIRLGFNADLCGLKKGMQVISVNDQPVNSAVKSFLPKSVSAYDKEMYEYAANMLLAGTHNVKRKIRTSLNGVSKDYYPDSIANKTEKNYESLLESKILEKNIGYIKINNSLGNSDLIQAFDKALDSLYNTGGMILDLRKTPSGGTTTIARAIMGRFTSREIPYQKHIYTADEKETGIRRSTLELVSPRTKVYTKPLIVLVGYWTGSMGEGMAIGFDTMKNVKVAGTKMAGLLGEIYTFETPEMKIPFSFPCVQLQTVAGVPREDYMPPFQVKDQKEGISNALNLLAGK